MNEDMHITFNGIYGIENIKIINNHRYELEEIQKTNGSWISEDNRDKYKRFKDILLEIYSEHNEPIIMEHYNDDKIFFHPDMEKKVQWFIDHKCCWKDKQFRLDRYYQLMVDSPMSAYYMVIVVLKQIIYTRDKDKLRMMNMTNNPSDIISHKLSPSDNIVPPPIGFNIIKETDQEFKDAFIVVRK